MTSQTVLPRWRGFNLLEFFGIGSGPEALQPKPFNEDDFRWMADWGFDFARIPMNFQLWIVNKDPFTVDESVIEKLDDLLRLGETYRIHVSLNFHTAPGYRIGAKRVPPGNLWKDQKALDAFCFHWSYFAKRYKGIPSSRLSFDLVNEPPDLSKEMTLNDYIRVTTTATNAIRAVDPDRLVIADGYGVGVASPVNSLRRLALRRAPVPTTPIASATISRPGRMGCITHALSGPNPMAGIAPSWKNSTNHGLHSRKAASAFTAVKVGRSITPRTMSFWHGSATRLTSSPNTTLALRSGTFEVRSAFWTQGARMWHTSIGMDTSWTRNCCACCKRIECPSKMEIVRKFIEGVSKAL